MSNLYIMKLDTNKMNKYLNLKKYDFRLFNMAYTDVETKTINNFVLNKTNYYEYFGDFTILKSLDNIKSYLSQIGTNSILSINKMEKILLNIIKKVLKAYKLNHFWLSIRATLPNHEFDIPRWHKDGNYFPKDLLKINDSKFVTVLKGPGTLLIKSTNQSNKIYKYYQKKEQKEFMTSINKDSTRDEQIKLSIALSKKYRSIYAQKLAKQKIIQAKNNQGIIFYAGQPEENSTLHSEPKHDHPRLFISIVPSTETNIKALQERWKK